MTKPPCSEWHLWKGAEIEGTKGIGEQTLFIRSLSDFEPIDDKGMFAEILYKKSGCSRVWFCKEFKDWLFIDMISSHFKDVCIEVTPQAYLNVPAKFRRESKFRIYVKVDMPKLKKGDFICVGPAFSDESFEIGTGTVVSPEMYLKDKKIK